MDCGASAALTRLLRCVRPPLDLQGFEARAIISATILIPIQIAQAREARGFAQGGVIPARYWRLGRLWVIWGTIATLLPLANLYFMVMKPA